jgi:cytochrome c oxidase assembly protein subunit 15
LEPCVLPRWLHRWAALTVCATFVLLFLGAVVTTFRVGMADPIWPTYPWHLLLISWDEPSAGFLIEHSHRLAGYIVGCCVIVLAAGLWRCDPRAWVRRLGLLALALIIVQGLLGGFRVKLHALLGPNLALIHGSFAQVVFALLVGLAAVTSPRWALGSARPESHHMQRWSLVVVSLLFVQIVLGVFLRHTFSPVSQRGHLLVSFAVVAAVVWLVKLAVEEGDRTLLLPLLFLGGLIVVQVLLGVEAWLLRFRAEMQPDAQITIGQAAVRTAHVMCGYGVLAAAVVAAVRSYRQPTVEVSLAPAGKLEGTT